MVQSPSKNPKLADSGGTWPELAHTRQICQIYQKRQNMPAALYPLSSIVLNGLNVAFDLYLSVTGTICYRAEFNIKILDNTVYGVRPFVYALLAITDPVRAHQKTPIKYTIFQWYLIRAVRAAANRLRKDDSTGNGSSGGPTSHKTGRADYGAHSISIGGWQLS
ncbi:hypothetical protein B0H11DRAFT_1908090 [Mycena galericulata]|nr:hypothetical protein B0H11DRAFT_1908090 [Mycena galericulata]